MNNWKHVLFKNIGWATGSEGILRISRIIVAIFMVRWLGPSEYGIYVFAFSSVGIYSALMDPGVSAYVQRLLAQRSKFSKWTWHIFRLKLIIIFSAGILMMLFMSTFINESQRLYAVLIMVIYYMCLELVNTAYIVLRGANKFRYEFLLRLTYTIVSSGVVLFSIFILPTAFVAILSQLIIAIIFSLAILLYVNDRAKPIRSASILKIEMIIFRRALPVGMISATAIAYSYIDTFLIGIFANDRDVGLYGAAIRILLILQLPTAIIGQTLYPLITRDLHIAGGSLSIKWAYIYRVLIGLSVLATLGIYSVGEEIVLLVFGAEYLKSAEILIILSYGLPGFMLFPIFSQILVMSGQIKFVAVATFLVMLLIVAANLSAPEGDKVNWLAWCMSVGHSLLALCLAVLLRLKLKLDILSGIFSSPVIYAVFLGLLLVGLLEALQIINAWKITIFIFGTIIISTLTLFSNHNSVEEEH